MITAVIENQQILQEEDRAVCKIYDNTDCEIMKDKDWNDVEIPRLIAQYVYYDLVNQINNVETQLNILKSHKEIIDLSRE